MKQTLNDSSGLGAATGPASATGPATGRGSGSVWRHRDLRVIAAGRAGSLLGDELAIVATLLFAHAAGWGPAGVCGLLVVAALPAVVGAVPAGRCADRFDSRSLLVTTALVQAVCAGILAALVATGGRHPGLLATIGVLAAVFAVNAGQAVAGPAWLALVPAVVGAEAIGEGVSAVQLATQISAVCGPAVAGVVVGTWSAGAAIALDALSFLALAVAAAAVRTRRVPSPEQARRERARAGFDLFLREDRALGRLLLGLLAVTLSAQVAAVVTVFLAEDELHAGARGYGLVMAAAAAGVGLGAVAAGRARSSRAQVWGALAGTAAAGLGVLLAAGAPDALLLGAFLALGGAGNGMLVVCFHALALGRIPDRVRGRVVAAIVGTMQAATLGGLLLGGSVARACGPRGALLLAGVLALGVSGLIALTTRPGPAPAAR